MHVPKSVSKSQVKTMKFFPNFHTARRHGLADRVEAYSLHSPPFFRGNWEKADPFAPAPAGIRPEWFFVFMFQTLKLIPAKVGFVDGEVLGVIGFGLGGLALCLCRSLKLRPHAESRCFSWRAALSRCSTSWF